MLQQNNTYNQSDVDDIMHQIDLFLKSNLRNCWIETDAIRIYVRESRRFVNEIPYPCFDFATIVATKQGTGLFTAIIKQFQQTYPDKNIFIESVLSDRFAEYIQHTLGFSRTQYVENNFYKLGSVAINDICNTIYSHMNVIQK